MGNPIYPFPFSKTKSKKFNKDSVAPMPNPDNQDNQAQTPKSTASDEHSKQPMLRGPAPSVMLVEPDQKKPTRLSRALRAIRALCRTLPIFNPNCSRIPSPCKPATNRLLSSADFHNMSPTVHLTTSSSVSADRITGTLFGYRKGRVSFAFQQTPRCLPSLVIELALQTHTLLREMGTGMVRIALESEKRPDQKSREHTKLLDEPLWTMFCNGKKGGYGVRREATEEDLMVMETLRPVSMGAGVLPGKSDVEGPDGEMTYVRAYFEHVVGSRDSETLYMLSPDGRNGPELTIFFVRI
ncbi:hypothetical protein LUZ60_003061 [Juncus effusus]|nr:hypothetical protein LUZ60_003061 [Juncus effusus]